MSDIAGSPDQLPPPGSGDEQAMQSNERRLRQAADNIPALISYVNRDLKYEFNNQTYYDWFGVDGNALVGRSVREVLGDDVFRQREPYLKAALQGEMVQFEGPTRHRRLGLRDTQLTYVPDKNDSGEVRGFYVLAHDITEYKRAQEVLQNADRRKDEFLATLAHELRNPLAPIRNAIDLLQLVGTDAAQINELRLIMDRQMRQLIRLIDDLLDLSRISRGKIRLQKQLMPLMDAIQAAVEATRPFVDDAGHEVIVTPPDRSLLIEADSTRVAQIIINLLHNAVKYTPARGRIWLACTAEEHTVAISVRDNGVGIPQERLADIFEMFTQVERTLESSQSGLGIGLTLVKSLVEMHGGSVAAFSEGRGQGSEFVVRLPLPHASPVDVSAASRPQAMPAASGFRVLVVEDSRPVAEIFAMLLRALGHDVHVIFSPSDVLDWTLSEKPDIIFSDISMPEMSGYELASRLRAQPELREVYLVAMTGYGQSEDRDHAMKSGFDDHMVKPAEMDQLQQLFEQLRARRGAGLPLRTALESS